MTDPKTLAEQVVMRNVKREIGSAAKVLLEQTALAAIEARDKEWREREVDLKDQIDVWYNEVLELRAALAGCKERVPGFKEGMTSDVTKEQQ